MNYEMYFQPSKVSVKRSRKDKAPNQVDSEEFKLYQNEPPKPSMTEIFQESSNDLLLFGEKEIQSKCVFHNSIIQSKDKFSL